VVKQRLSPEKPGGSFNTQAFSLGIRRYFPRRDGFHKAINPNSFAIITDKLGVALAFRHGAQAVFNMNAGKESNRAFGFEGAEGGKHGHRVRAA
jgi:hypothetical protein